MADDVESDDVHDGITEPFVFVRCYACASSTAVSLVRTVAHCDICGATAAVPALARE
jgi:ribosomal protein S27E